MTRLVDKSKLVSTEEFPHLTASSRCPFCGQNKPTTLALCGECYTLQLDEQRAIDGKARSNTARYLNHSCRPNAIGYTIRNKIWIYSLCQIEAGAELTIDYVKDYIRYHMTKKSCRCQTCEK